MQRAVVLLWEDSGNFWVQLATPMSASVFESVRHPPPGGELAHDPMLEIGAAMLPLQSAVYAARYFQLLRAVAWKYRPPSCHVPVLLYVLDRPGCSSPGRAKQAGRHRGQRGRWEPRDCVCRGAAAPMVDFLRVAVAAC